MPNLLVFFEKDVLDGVSISPKGVFLNLNDPVGVEVELSEVVEWAEGVGGDVVQAVVAQLQPLQII